jgi:hypothetical protein
MKTGGQVREVGKGKRRKEIGKDKSEDWKGDWEFSQITVKKS